MGIILRSQVAVSSVGLSFGGKPAVMDLHDDGRFVLIRFDPRTGEFGEKVFDTSIANLKVGGSSTHLQVGFGKTKRRVEFSSNAPVGFGSLGLIGLVVANEYANAAGLRAWVAAFRASGVLRGYFTLGRRLAVFGGIFLGILIVMIALIAIGNAAANVG